MPDAVSGPVLSVSANESPAAPIQVWLPEVNVARLRLPPASVTIPPPTLREIPFSRSVNSEPLSGEPAVSVTTPVTDFETRSKFATVTANRPLRVTLTFAPLTSTRSSATLLPSALTLANVQLWISFPTGPVL